MTLSESGLAPSLLGVFAGGREVACHREERDGTVELTARSPGAPELELRFQLEPGERIVGFGEQYGAFDQRGRAVDGWIESLMGAGPRSSYHLAPLWYSSRGHAVQVDTTLRWSADVGAADPEVLAFRSPGDTVGARIFRMPPAAVLGRLAAAMPPALPPAWAYGPWCAARSGTEAVLAEARRLRAARLPCAAIWVDDFWDEETNTGDGISFPYPEGEYPDLRRLTDGLHEYGVRALAYLNPVLYRDTAWYRDCLGRKLAVRDPDGGFHHLRFFHPRGDNQTEIQMLEGNAALLELREPEAVRLFEDNVGRLLLERGWDGWMQDFGEQHPDPAAHNEYPLLYHAATQRALRRTGKDALFFVRSGYLGSQAFAPITWGGDQGSDWTGDRGLPSLVPAAASIGLAGVPVWGPDISGLVELDSDPTGRGGVDEELWIRWLQLGALTPVMRIHLGFKNRHGKGVDLWHSGRTVDAYRRFAELHLSLAPYLQELAAQARSSGLPLIRALALEFPDDPECWDLGHQYLLGDRLLVAPVVEPGADERRLYLPEGGWRDHWSGRTLRGPGWVTVPAPLEQIPLLVREGAPTPL